MVKTPGWRQATQGVVAAWLALSGASALAHVLRDDALSCRLPGEAGWDRDQDG